MKEKFKFEPKHYGMKCNVLYVYPLTIVGYIPEKKLVVVTYHDGKYDSSRYYIPEEDILIYEKDLLN